MTLNIKRFAALIGKFPRWRRASRLLRRTLVAGSTGRARDGGPVHGYKHWRHARAELK